MRLEVAAHILKVSGIFNYQIKKDECQTPVPNCDSQNSSKSRVVLFNVIVQLFHEPLYPHS